MGLSRLRQDLTAQFGGITQRRWLIAIIIAAALSFVAKVDIAKNTYGSLDALLRETNIIDLRHHGPLALYRNGTDVWLNGHFDHSEVFNHPPFMIRLLSAWGRLANVTGLPLRFWVRFTCAMADLASIALLAAMMLRHQGRTLPATLVLAAVSPVSLMISGFHYNADPIMVAFLLLSIYLLDTGRSGLAGLALGMAISIKIVPLIFIPAFLLYLTGRKRLNFALATAGTFLATSLPVLAQDPLLIWQKVFCYNPQSGVWGISRFVFALGSEASFHAYTETARIPVLGLLIIIAVWMNVRHSKPPLALQCGLLSFTFLAVIPGFGVQYLAWLVPWTCFLTFRQALSFHATAGLLLFSYYNRAAGGLPWNLAYSGKSEWYGSVVFIGILCWLVVSSLAIYSARRMSRSMKLDCNTRPVEVYGRRELGSALVQKHP